MSENFILIAAGVAVLFGAEAIYYLVRFAGESDRAELKRRLHALDQPGHTSLMRDRRLARSPVLGRLLESLPGTAELDVWLRQTDLSWSVGSTLGGGLLLSIMVCAGLLFLTHNPWLASAGVPIGVMIPILIVANARTRRSEKITEQLPDALDMLSRSLQAGHGLASGFKLVATEMPLPIAVEFGRSFEEQNVGVEFRVAIENMTKRVPNNLDLRIFAVSIVIQSQTGGNLVDILQQISLTLRERFKFYGKVRSLTAEGRASATILGAMPFIAALLITYMNPKYMLPLIEDSLGQMILAGGLAMWAFGFVWIRSLVKVEF
jgi:tight adherence protein B